MTEEYRVPDGMVGLSECGSLCSGVSIISTAPPWDSVLEAPGNPEPSGLKGLPLLTCYFWTGRTVIAPSEYSRGPTTTSFTWCWLLPSALLFFFFFIPF